MKLNNNWCILPTRFGDFRMYDTQDEYIRIITYSPLENISKNPLFRMHSSCIASEVFGAKDCDCADQLYEAMKLIASEENGLIIHIHQEGRGHGLSKKIEAVSIMQKENCDTAESFEKLNLKQDIRDYTKPIEVLKFLNINSVRLISNNPYKINFLKRHKIDVEVIPTHPKIRKENKKYLYTKNAKLGHTLPLNIEEKNGEINFYHSDQKWGEFSNFSNYAVYIDGKIWKTVEHFYQAQKFKNTKFENLVRETQTPTLAKIKAYEFLEKHTPENWINKKEKIMYKGLEAKFSQHPDLNKLLISTQYKTLIERSDTDDYWGDGKDKNGRNRLGFLLMKLRQKKLKEIEVIKSESLIKQFWNIKTSLKNLGKGDEGIVYTDEKWVYKMFYDITDKEWNFLKDKSSYFNNSPTLEKIECLQIDNKRCIRYPYRTFKPLNVFDKNEIISFLKFCKLHKIIFANIKPLNFIQTQSGIKLIDYGRSFINYTDGELLNTTKRAYLLWKFPTMENDKFKKFTQKINMQEEFPEIKGWEEFWDKVKP